MTWHVFMSYMNLIQHVLPGCFFSSLEQGMISKLHATSHPVTWIPNQTQTSTSEANVLPTGLSLLLNLPTHADSFHLHTYFSHVCTFQISIIRHRYVKSTFFIILVLVSVKPALFLPW